MKRYISTLAALAVAGALASSARAQYPGYPIQPGPGMMGAPGQAPQAMPEPVPVAVSGGCATCNEGKYGFHPLIKSGLGLKHKCGGDSSHGPILKKHDGYNMGLGIVDWLHGMKKKYGPLSNDPHAHMPPNYAQGGTLAFPHHPYVRGPRDFFMVDR